MIQGLIDSHCHLDIEPIKSNIINILEGASSAGINSFVLPGVHPDAWGGIKKMAELDARILPSYGVHPMYADVVNGLVLSQLKEFVTTGVAIGEIGLDRKYPIPIEIQEITFREQLRLAVECGLPVLIHCRQAFQMLLQIMREEGADNVGGIMHAYSGSFEMACDFIKLGFVISISGSVTWGNAKKTADIAKRLSLEHLVLETDAPDMTPERYRGKSNRPEWLLETVSCVAALRGTTAEEVALVTTENVRRVLRL